MVTACRNCRRELPDTDRFCRYCGVEVDKPVTEPLSTSVRTVSVIGALALLALTGLWLQFRSPPTRPSEVGGPRQTPTPIEVGPASSPEQEAAFAETESLLTVDTGSLIVIPPQTNEAVVLHPNAPRQGISLPPATRWEITANALVGFTDDDRVKVIRFSAPDQVIETKAERVYTDLGGELLYTWRDGDRIRVRPVFEQDATSSGDFSTGAPPRGAGQMPIGPLLVTYEGDTYGWNGEGQWERLASGVAEVASDPLVTTQCDGGFSSDFVCTARLINLQTGEQRTVDEDLGWFGAVPSPDLSWVFSSESRTLTDTTELTTVAISVPATSRDTQALWALDSSMVGVAGKGLRLFNTRGEILADLIRAEDMAGSEKTASAVARFVRTDAFEPDR